MAGKDEHDSPQNPDNRIELGRQAADDKHKADILAHPAGEPRGKELHQPVPRAASQKAAVRLVGGQVKAVATTGHSWDGIEEFDNPMPRWWLWVLYATIIWGVLYTIAYPAWPLLTRATPGVVGHSTRADVASEIDRFNGMNAPVRAKLEAADLTAVAADPELASYARNAGAAVFRTWCAQCHGSGAAGVQASGYPNLLDDDWLWGGDMEAIHATVTHGIRNTTDADARFSEMPKFGEMLEKPQIEALVHHVRAISGQEHDAGLAAEGEPLFAENCAACHGDDGTGMRDLGAPNLTDAIWLYGGDVASLTKSIAEARFGVMPAWGDRLSEADIRAVAFYVHGLGGGE